MKVLFVPAHHMGAISHGIPLLALSQMLGTEFTTAFLLPCHFHRFFSAHGATVLDISHEDLRTQMIAYHRFKPDIVVDDLSFTTYFASQLSYVPRVTVQRTGIFYGSPQHEGRHSCEEGLKSIPDVSALGIEIPNTLSDLVKAEAVIIPGLRSIECLPDHLKQKREYYYTGPLLLKDSSIALDGSVSEESHAVERFLEKNAGRQIVLLTFGTIAETPPFIPQSICQLLSRGIAVISTVLLEVVPPSCEDLFHYGRFLPFHRICSQAALIIHHCGSGTYQYPILHSLPSVIVATGFYDRDDVAKRLDDLGAAIHLHGSEDQEGMGQRCIQAIQSLLDPDSSRQRSMRAVLSTLKMEVEQTVSSFRFADVLAEVSSRAESRGGQVTR